LQLSTISLGPGIRHTPKPLAHITAYILTPSGSSIAVLMLPDYPDRAIAAARIRVERASLFCQMTLIAIGAWWLFESFGSDSGPIIAYGPVVMLFSSALLMPDLVEFGPVGRTRASTAACIFWPPMLAFAEVNRYGGAETGAVVALVAVVFFLFLFSREVLNSGVNPRRWRGISTMVGFGLAIPVIATIPNPESWLFISIAALTSTLPNLLAKDGSEEARRVFYYRLKKAERGVLEVQSGNTLMQQPNSLLKTAREEGRKNPERGLYLVEEAEREVERILSMVEDLEEIRDQSDRAVNRAEEITGFTGEARRIFARAEEELENGSLRTAEQGFRDAKIRASQIESHWDSASSAISEAEGAVGSAEGHLVEGLRSTLEAAKKAMEDEDPEYALAIVSEIPSQMEDVQGLMSRATRSIEDAESALSSQPGSTEDAGKRLKEAKEAMESGNASLAIGLADGVVRSIRSEGEAQSSVQRALRQRKTIEEKIPSGSTRQDWMSRLDDIEALASSERWLDASVTLASLTSDLASLASRTEEASEMLEFLNDDWLKLRKRLDSSGIGPDSIERSTCERALASAADALSEGAIEACLESIGRADSAMESLRRLV